MIVWKLDRFSRDRYDSAHYKHILKKNGVKVVSAKENAMKCKNNGGNIPLGYYVDKSTGILAVNETEAPIVREIFAMYDEGKKITEIMNHLNGKGIRTQNGKLFTNGGIGRILQNRKYIGEYKYDTIVIPDGIPAIIDKDMFERVQRKLALNRNAPARAKAPVEYILPRSCSAAPAAV